MKTTRTFLLDRLDRVLFGSGKWQAVRVTALALPPLVFYLSIGHAV